ncbi:MAG: biopolymer transporter ExbD [Xanthomonadales bacterium]
MKLQNRIKEEPNIDLTSLIDVVFLLLLFFMVSTTFDTQAVLKVDLPDASTVDAPTDLPEGLELVIDADGRMFLNDRQLLDSEERTIKAAFKEAVGDDRDLPLILRADRETPHHFVVTVMDVAAQLGFSNLSIATNRKAGSEE